MFGALLKLLLALLLTTFTSSIVGAAADTATSDEIGTFCAENLENAWLDLVFVIELSHSISKYDINDKSSQLDTLIERINITQDVNMTHSSRIGVVVYGSDASVLLHLNESSKDKVWEVMKTLNDNRKLDDYGNDINKALRKAADMLENQKSFRIPGIVLYATTYNPENEALQTSIQLKENGIHLIVLTYIPPEGVASPLLANLASPGASFNSTHEDVIELVSSSLSLMNCKCPIGMYQLKINNKKYGDCLYGYPTYISPILAHNGCKPGIIVSVNSKDKMNFITDKIIPTHLLNHTIFSTSGSFVNGYWRWLTYDNKLVPFGNYPEISPRTSGSFGYFQLVDKEWIFIGDNAGHHDTRPYICQIKSCDTDHFC